MSEPLPYFEKIKGIIDSCVNPEHFFSCHTVLELYEAKYGFTDELVMLTRMLAERDGILKEFDSPILEVQKGNFFMCNDYK